MAQRAYLNFGGKSYPVDISMYGQTVLAKPVEKTDLEQIKQYVKTGKTRAATSADRKRARETFRGKAAMDEETIEEMAVADLKDIDLSSSASKIANQYVQNYKERTSKPFTKQALSAMKKTLSGKVEDDVVASAVESAEKMVEGGTPTGEKKKKTSKGPKPNTEAVRAAAKRAADVMKEEILSRSDVDLNENKMYAYDKDDTMYMKTGDNRKMYAGTDGKMYAKKTDHAMMTKKMMMKNRNNAWAKKIDDYSKKDKMYAKDDKGIMYACGKDHRMYAKKDKDDYETSGDNRAYGKKVYSRVTEDTEEYKCKYCGMSFDSGEIRDKHTRTCI